MHAYRTNTNPSHAYNYWLTRIFYRFIFYSRTTGVFYELAWKQSPFIWYVATNNTTNHSVYIL
jgi:hypothetical protein